MKDRPIKIVPVMNGFIVEVGCRTLIAETKSKLISELVRYLTNPAAVEEEYFKRYEPGALNSAVQANPDQSLRTMRGISNMISPAPETACGDKTAATASLSGF